MISQAHIAILALRHPSARMTLHHRCKTTTILEKNDLLLPLQGIVNFFHQQRRKRTLHPFLMCQFLDIHPFDMRQLDILVSFFQFHQAILTIGRIEVTFHTGCSGSQKHFRPIDGSQHGCRTPGMVTRSRILLFIRIFMFLIHNHQAQSFERQKDG